MTKKEIGLSIKLHRVKNAETQQTIAGLFDMAPSSYSNKEGGKRPFTLNEAIDLANFFNVSLDDLVGRKFSICKE